MTSPVLLSDMQTIVQIDDRLLHELCEQIYYEQASDGVWVRASELDRYEGLLIERERSRLDDAEVEYIREQRDAG
jgi:hypothetical protein